MRLISWNINGIRAAHRKGFMHWFQQEQPEILALQEVRALPEQVPKDIRHADHYHTFWYPAEKRGYSGVGLMSKTRPLAVHNGLGQPEFDNEGRVMIAEYEHFTLFNGYFPSGTRSQERVEYKLAFNEAFLSAIEDVRATGKPIIVCGDVNIAHHPIDLTNPKANAKNSGFLPIEREWLDRLQKLGYVDSFRHFYPNKPEMYSWWTQRGNARERNVGWRIDYFLVSENLVPAMHDALILHEVLGSDHCPVALDLSPHKLAQLTAD